MPQVRKLAPEEVRTLEYVGSTKRQQVEEEYDTLLRDFHVGDYGVAELAGEEKRMTVYMRLRAAAQRRSLTLRFVRTSGDRLRFRVVAGDEGGGGVRVT